MDYVEQMSRRSGITQQQLVQWLGISRSKFYEWVLRRGRANAHNGPVPRGHWLLPRERQAIEEYCRGRVGIEGYRRLTYMMLDEDVAAVSPATTYRVLSEAGLLRRWNTPGANAKGTGFTQPTAPHQHWHTDICYVNILGTVYFLIVVLDGYSRFILHHELRASMTTHDVEVAMQCAREKYPHAHPRLITDNGAQFVSRDFQAYLRLAQLTHVRTSVAYPQSNGKLERVNRTIKTEHIRRSSYISLDDARAQIARYIEHYNERRLHSALYYLSPRDVLEGRTTQRLAQRQAKLDAARAARREAA